MFSMASSSSSNCRSGEEIDNRIALPTLTKKQKISLHCELLKPGCTKTALAQILHTLHRNGLLDKSMAAESERAVKETLQQALKVHSECNTPYGPVVQRMNLGKSMPDWSFIHPCALLYHLSDVCTSFGDLMGELIGLQFRKLRVILYIDELTPGNPLRVDKARTVQSVYWTFLEFPQHILQRSECWFLFGCLRSSIADSLDGGASGFMRSVMHKFFLCKEFNLRVGANVKFQNKLITVRADFGGFLADEKAHKELLNIKGASGMKCCPTCKNVVRFLDTDSSQYLVDLKCCKYSKFDYHTNASFYECVDHLRQEKANMSKKQFDELQKFLGMNYDEHSLLFDDSLREVLAPIDNCIRDWMHTMVSGGVAGTEVSLMLLELQNHFSLDDVIKYAMQYNLPKARSQPTADWFQTKRIADDQMRTPAASDNISLACLLNAFLQDIAVPLGKLNKHCVCFKLLNSILVSVFAGA